MSFTTFLKRNLAYIRLGSLARLEYGIDFVMLAFIVPVIAYGVECAFWVGIFQASDQQLIAGFSQAQYFTYLLWLMTQLGTANWRFERIMISDINSGSVNSLLVRPGSFFEFHLGQLLGMKFLTLISAIPMVLCIAWYWSLPLLLPRLLPAIALGLCYLVMIYTLNFAIACLAFVFDHVYSMNVTKNMVLWLLAGELIPLDLLPSPWKEWMIALPFSAGVYIPAGYISGRVSTELFAQSFISVFIGTLFFGAIGRLMWNFGLRRYSGTGA